MQKFYITTPIYYVNDEPHIGHAYTTLAADVIARFKRLSGFDVWFLTGTDEHGQKIEKAAANSRIDTQEFVDNFSNNFRKLFKVLNISNDDFIRTTEARHKEFVSKIWQHISGGSVN
jgi:methionyl-tRNA synthetase